MFHFAQSVVLQMVEATGNIIALHQETKTGTRIDITPMGRKIPYILGCGATRQVYKRGLP